VAAQFRQAGLREVRLQPVEAKDARGANVLGVLRGPGTEFLVLAAHHDTAPDSPGAYGSGGGVGILIEAARALARRADRPRSVVFASFDGREPYLGGRGGLAGTYVESLGPEGRQLVGALVLDRAGSLARVGSVLLGAAAVLQNCPGSPSWPWAAWPGRVGS
jgi:hypothetical protein